MSERSTQTTLVGADEAEGERPVDCPSCGTLGDYGPWESDQIRVCPDEACRVRSFAVD